MNLFNILINEKIDKGNFVSYYILLSFYTLKFFSITYQRFPPLSLFIPLQIMHSSFISPSKFFQPYWMDLMLPGIASLSQGYWAWGQLGGATVHCALSLLQLAEIYIFMQSFDVQLSFLPPTPHSPSQFMLFCKAREKNSRYICVIFCSCNVRWLSRWNVFGKFK